MAPRNIPICSRVKMTLAKVILESDYRYVFGMMELSMKKKSLFFSFFYDSYSPISNYKRMRKVLINRQNMPVNQILNKSTVLGFGALYKI